MAQNIQATNTTITFDKIENLSSKKVYSSIGKPIFTDGDLTLTDKTLDINALIDINTTSNNLEDNLPFPSLLLNWSGAQLPINGQTYKINTTPELIEAINASANYADKLSGTEFYNEYNSLLDRLTYIESLLPKIIRYRWYDRTGINIGDEEGINLNGKVTMLPSDGMDNSEENFIGWICSLDGTLYQPGEIFTLTQELYDLCGDGYLIEFRAMVEPKTYQVGIDVTNGEWLGTSPQTVEYGGYAYWKVYANDGYKLPTSVINGTIFDDNQYYENNSQMVTSNKVTEDFTVYVNCEEDISYIEPEYPPVEYSFWIDGFKVYENVPIDLGQTIIIPAPNVYELGNNVELFEGWRCELDGNLYQPGDQYTLTQEDYDKVVGGVFIFNASFRDSYLVRINITHGYGIPDSPPQRIKTGEHASWEVSAFNGYKLPTSVTNGTISGNIVTSDEATKDFTVYVVCEEDISNTEPGSPDPE